MTPICESVTEAGPGRGTGRFSTRTQIVLATCACAGVSAFVYAVDPHQHAVYPQCLLYNTTGIYCAGCGATRALHALLHGRFLDALHDNALFVTALPLLGYLAGSHALTAWRADAWPKIIIKDPGLVRRGIGFVMLMMGFMALRNLPGWPFDWLKPL